MTKAERLPASVRDEIARRALDQIDDYFAKLSAVEAGEASIAAGEGAPWSDVRARLLKRCEELEQSPNPSK